MPIQLFQFNKIKNFYNTSMKANKYEIQLWDLHLNKNDFSLLLTSIEKNNKDQKVLHFNKTGSNEELTFLLNDNFEIKFNYKNKKRLSEIRLFFNAEYEKRGSKVSFHIFTLFNEIQSRMQLHITDSHMNREDLTRIYHLENPNARYYKGCKNWATSLSGYHHSKTNRGKVEILLPSLFQLIKDQDITVYFTNTKADETSRIQDDFDQYRT